MGHGFPRFGRRQLLGGGAAVALGAGAACSATPSLAPADGGAADAGTNANVGTDARGPRQRVIVVGAGLAGLAAGWRLVALGHDVTVVEAQARVGGRVLTLGTLGADCPAEAGALAFSEAHERVVKLARELDLSTVALGDGERVYSVGGARFVHHGTEAWPLAGLSTAEQAKGSALLDDYLRTDLVDVGDPRQPGWPRANALALDARSMREHLLARGASEPWLALLEAELGGELVGLSALAGVADVALRPAAGARLLAVEGGNGALITRLAEKLGDRLRRSSPVVRIERDEAGARVFVRDPGGGSSVLACDHLVVAVPFAALRKIEISPLFSGDKGRAVAELDMLPAARVLLRTRSRFWQRDPLGVLGGPLAVATDARAIGRVADATPRGAAGGLLVGMLEGAGAQELAAVAPEARLETYRSKLASALPHDAAEVTGGEVVLWGAADAWIGGGWGSPRPGQVAWMAPALARAEGRVHFAGEHTSPYRATLEGAIESALRCVSEIDT